MAFYTTPSNDKNATRTSSYKFSVESKYDQSLMNLKADIAQHNARVRKMVRRGFAELVDWRRPQLGGVSLLRVKLEARGPRRHMDGSILHPNADCSLRHRYAAHFDVYVHEDSHNNSVLREEIGTGLTPGQLRAVKKAEAEKFQLELELDEQLREKGIVATFEDGKKVYISREESVQRLRDRGVSESIITRIHG